MKKNILIFIVYIITSAGLFAEDDGVDRELLFYAGFANDKTSVKEIEASYTAKQFMVGADFCALVKPVDMFGIGLSCGAGCGIGLTDNMKMESPWGTLHGNNGKGLSLSYYLEIGPAIAFYLGSILRIGGNFCYTYGFKKDDAFQYKVKDFNYSTIIKTPYGGFSTNVQAKFFPNILISPVFGWKYTRGFSTCINIHTSSSDVNYKESTHHRYKYSFYRNLYYAGLSVKL